MHIVYHEPPAAYRSLVEAIFHYSGFHPDHSIERVVPTGHVFLIIELDGMLRHTYDSETLQPNAEYQKAWVSGLHRNHLSISAHDNFEMFVIQFKAIGAYPFLNFPMQALADRVVPGDQFEGLNLYALRERLYRAASSEEKFAIADAWLDSCFDDKRLPPQALIEFVAALHEQPSAKLKDIVDSFDGTQKHLISLFRKFTGVTPKQYQRILRFNEVFVLMQNDQFLSWSDIAYRCGFSDQSHFIREFKQFSGFVPESFIKQGFDEDSPNFFPLDREEQQS